MDSFDTVIARPEYRRADCFEVEPQVVDMDWLAAIRVPSFREYVERHIFVWAKDRETMLMMTGRESTLSLELPPYSSDGADDLLPLLVELRDQYQFEGKFDLALLVDLMFANAGHEELMRPPLNVGHSP